MHRPTFFHACTDRIIPENTSELKKIEYPVVMGFEHIDYPSSQWVEAPQWWWQI